MIVFHTIIIAILASTISIFLPGIYMASVFSKKFKIKFDYLSFLLLAISLGFLYNTLQFIIIMMIRNYTLIPHYLLVSTKYFIDILLILGLITYYYGHIKNSIHKLSSSFSRNILTIFISLLCLVLGVLIVSGYPHSLDCLQLKWTKGFIDNIANNSSNNVGAIGYSALIYFPGVIFKNIPLVTIAAGFKFFLPLFLWLVVNYVISKLDFKQPIITKITYAIIIFFSFFGTYGIAQVGKDSIFGVLFSILYIASLMAIKDNKKNNIRYIISGVFFACAITSGTITIPYLFLVTGLYLIYAANNIKPFLLLFWIIFVSGIGLVISFKRMANIPLTHSTIFLAICCAILYALRNKSFPLQNYLWQKRNIILTIISPIIIIALLIAATFLMPVKVAIIPAIDAAGKTIVEYRPPLDGTYSFIKYLMHTGCLINIFGISGVFLSFFTKRFSRNYGLNAFALFPFLMIFMVLLLCHYRFLPFSGFNLWDMIRDLPNWYFPFFFGLFALIFLDIIIFYLPINPSLRKIIFILFCILIMFVSIDKYKDKLRQIIKPAHLTNIGGDKDLLFAELTQYLFQTKTKANAIYISKESKAFYMLYSYQMYTNIPVYSLSVFNQQDLIAMMQNSVSILIADQKNLFPLLNEKIKITKIYQPTSPDTSVFLLTKSKRFQSDIDIPNSSLDLSQGIYATEKIGDHVFHWVEKESEINLRARKGKYKIIINIARCSCSPKQEQSDKLKIFFNDNLIKKVDFSNASFDNPVKVKLIVIVSKNENSIKLIANRTSFSYPPDTRNLNYAIIMPIKVTRLN